MSIEKQKFDKFVSFIKKAFEEVTTELVESEYKPDESLQLQSNNRVVIIIGTCGKSKGRILLETTFDTTAGFALAMNFGEPFDDAKDIYLYVAEFANIFCGRATTYANNEYKEREFWLAPPAIFSGEDLEIASPLMQSEVVCYGGKEGVFSLDIGFEE